MNITSDSGAVVRVIHEPGNGTRYAAIGVNLKLPDYHDAWLIYFENTGASYVFNSGAFVAYSYVEEKMGVDRRANRIGEVDLHEMCKVIAKIIGGTHAAGTDKTGRLPVLRIAR